MNKLTSTVQINKQECLNPLKFELWEGLEDLETLSITLSKLTHNLKWRLIVQEQQSST